MQHFKSIGTTTALLLILCDLANPAVAAPITLPLSGNGATGALNFVNFDNEINEPNAFPPSREYVSPSEGNSSSHGFPYFQYRYDEANPDPFNNYSNEDIPEESFWSIIVSSHTVAGEDYWRSLLKKAGAVTYANLTTNTTVLHPNPGAFNLGSLTYDSSSITGTGLEIIPASAVTLTVTRSDYNFNVLNEDTTPGNWVGYPYYYWSVDMNYTLGVRNLVGPGLLFSNGKLIGIEITAVAEIKNYSGNITWAGKLRLTEHGFSYDINDSNYVSGFGELHVIMDRSGPISLPGVAPDAAGKLRLETSGANKVARLEGWPSHGYRIERSSDLKTWTTHSWLNTDSAGKASITVPAPGATGIFYRAARLIPGETAP